MSSEEFWAAFATLSPREQEVMRRRHPRLGPRLVPWAEVAHAMRAFEFEVEELYARALEKLGVDAVDVRDSQYGGLD